MLTIRPDQLKTLGAYYRPRRRAAILARIRALPQRNAAGIDDDEALRRIEAAIEDGKAIGITHDGDVVRLASLAFLPEPLRTDPAIVRVVTRVLSRADWEPTQRLDLIDALLASS